MLATFRKQKKLLAIFLWIVIAAFIGTIFLVWGVGNRQKQADYAIKVNDIKIGYAEYKNAYEKTNKTLRQLFGGQPIPKALDVGKQVRDELINRYLLLQKAYKMQIPVSDAEVLAQIMKIPSFNINGQFDKKRYLEILRLNRIDPAAFEADIKQQLLLTKLSNIIKSAVKVTNKEIENEYNYRNTSTTISFIPLKYEDFLSQVKIDNNEINNFYNAHKENYRVPAKIKVKYTVFDPKTFNDNITISQDEIEAYYIKNKAKFDIPETVEAQHIITRVKDWNDKEAVKKAKTKIEKVLKELKSGKDFTELAKKYSEGPSAANGGNLGEFKKGDMVKEFEDVAFKLKPGEISGIVKSDFGFHIIKVNKHSSAKLLTVNEAKDEIVKSIKNEKESQAFRNYVLTTYKKILKASNISAYVDNGAKLKVFETNYFSIDDNIAPLNNDLKAKSALFKLKKTEISNIITIDNKQYIFEIYDKKDSYIPELKAVYNDVVKDYKADKAAEIAYNKAKEIIKQNNIKKISKLLKKSFITTPDFKRVEPIPQIGPNSDLSKKIFEAKPNTLLSEPFKINRISYIIAVNDITKPDFTKITDNEKMQIEQYILGLKQQEAYNDYLSKLKESAKIEINPRIIEK